MNRPPRIRWRSRRRHAWLLLAALGASAFGLVVRTLINEAIREPPDCSQIEEGLYLGAQVDQPPAGVQAVLNLSEFEDRYTAPVYVHRPIRDAPPAPSLDWLRRQVDFIAAQRQAGRPTFVHCLNGVSRSGLVVTAYLMRSHSWTRDEALAFVRSRRPSVRPHPAFMSLLGEWERSLSDAGGRRRPDE
jgi:hypothetical protein